MTLPVRILDVDDQPSICRFLRILLRTESYDVIEAATARDDIRTAPPSHHS